MLMQTCNIEASSFVSFVSRPIHISRMVGAHNFTGRFCYKTYKPPFKREQCYYTSDQKLKSFFFVFVFSSAGGIAAVPVFFVNGVELGVGNNKPTFDDWITFLDPIINANSN